MGGAVRIEGDDCEPIEAPNLPFVVGFDGGAGGDTGELVAGVGELREEYGFAADTVESIGDVVRTGEKLLADAVSEADPSPELLAELGSLMDFNHGLLSALGVSARSLDAMVWAACDAGAHGAKLTGAGGGGCIVALDASDASETALSFTRCEEAFRAEPRDRGCPGGGAVSADRGASGTERTDDASAPPGRAQARREPDHGQEPPGDARRRGARRGLRRGCECAR